MFTALVFACDVSAENMDVSEEFSSQISQAEELVPDEAYGFLEDNGLSIDDPSGFIELSPMQVLDYICGRVKDRASAPLRLLGRILAAVLISSLVSGMSTERIQSSSRTVDIITSLTVLTLISSPICEAAELTASTLKGGGTFMLGYVPVFASIAAAGGNITSSLTYSSIVLASAQLCVQTASETVLPLTGMCMALGAIEGISPQLSVAGMSEALKKAATVLIGIIMSVFVGLLSLQSMVSNAFDTVTLKAAKLVVSNAVPVVGSAVSDAYATVRASMSLLKNGTGIYGIAALVIMLLPPAAELFLTVASVQLGAFAAEMFGAVRVKLLLTSACAALKICLALTVCFSVIFIIATAVVMSAAVI